MMGEPQLLLDVQLDFQHPKKTGSTMLFETLFQALHICSKVKCSCSTGCNFCGGDKQKLTFRQIQNGATTGLSRQIESIQSAKFVLYGKHNLSLQ